MTTSAPAFAPPWHAWLAENLLRGVASDQLVAILVADGHGADEAEAAVAAIATSPAYPVAARLAHAAARSRSLDARARKLAAYASPAPGIERRSGLAVADFYRTYVATNTPVVLTDALAATPALTRWSPAYFREVAGEAPVRIMSGRDTDPRYHPNQERNWVETAFAAYIDHVEAAGENNDLYMVASNRNLERAELAPLLADLQPAPAVMAEDATADRQRLWFGPAGTRTPLHRDTHPVLLCQFYGRKRFWLVQPRDMTLLLHEDGYYAPLDAAAPDLVRFPDFADAEVLEVTIEPGEALYIPWDWWHQAQALDVSMSVTFDQFRRPEELWPEDATPRSGGAA